MDTKEETFSLNSVDDSLESKWTNISTSFSGLGYVIIDFESVIEMALSELELQIESLPTVVVVDHVLFHHYILCTIFSDVRYFYVENNNYYSLYAKYVMKRSHSLYFYSKINLEDRIALAFASRKRKQFIHHCLSSGLYVSNFEKHRVVFPYYYSFLYEPFDVYRPTEYIDDKISRLDSAGIARESFDDSFKKVEGKVFKYSKEEPVLYSREFVANLIEEAREHGNMFDGFVAREAFTEIYTSEDKKHSEAKKESNLSTQLKELEVRDCSVLDLSVKSIKFRGNDLDIIMPPIPEKLSMHHVLNLSKSAKSLYDGQTILFFTPQAEEKKTKTSQKVMKIIEENNRKIRDKKKQENEAWIQNLKIRYKAKSTLQERRQLLEDVSMKNEYIMMRVSLLKLEVYSEMWNIEKKNVRPNEEVLIPLYLECTQFIEKYHEENVCSHEELFHVFSTLAGSGFPSIAQELVEIHKVKNIPRLGSNKPNDTEIYFQLKYLGEHLKRTLNTTEDKRVPFKPDGWQVRVLDAVDAGKSIYISAPTSSGKTMICYYIIEKVYRENIERMQKKKRNKTRADKAIDGSEEVPMGRNFDKPSALHQFSKNLSVVVFCLPSKALGNQVSADVYARFKPEGSFSLQGTLFHDRCNDPFNSQILITIPSMLETILNNGALNIRYIVMDEFHMINERSLSMPIERFIQQARCPVVLLSATVGNVEEFYKMFAAIERAKGRECELIKHSERYSELKNFVYCNNLQKKQPGEFERFFGMNKDFKEVPVHGAVNGFNQMIAYTSNHLKHFGFGDDLKFLPEELLKLYYYLYTALPDEKKKISKCLAPRKFFKSNIISKSDIREYQKHLLGTFEKWVQESILQEKEIEQIYNNLLGDIKSQFSVSYGTQYLYDNIFDLINVLAEQDLLPVIVFNTNRDTVDRLAFELEKHMEKLDRVNQKSRETERIIKEQKRKRDEKKLKDAWKETPAEEIDVEFDECTKFTYTSDSNKCAKFEVDEIFGKNTSKKILNLAYRGIGIHHNSCSRKDKSATEILFRKKKLRVLFATETLALGINMPCRSVVFAGDSSNLNPINFKQMCGRAGRRGYDTIGNVIYFGIHMTRIQNLSASLLPRITGSYIYANSSLTFFNIDAQLTRNPLITLLAEKARKISENTEGLSEYHLDMLRDSCARSSLIDLQRASYPFIYTQSYLWDLFISCKALDPEIFILGFLIDRDVVNWEPEPFMILISYLFETIPAQNSSIKLPPLETPVVQELEKINQICAANIRASFPKSVVRIFENSSQNSFELPGFLKFWMIDVNAYVYDFFKHGSKQRTCEIFGIEKEVMWSRLFNIDLVLKNTAAMLLKYFGKDDYRYKEISKTYETFLAKYNEIFA